MVFPIFMKRGDQIKCRCDGLTSTPSKVLEQILNEKNIIKSLELNGKWGKLQHDFIKEGLYQTNLISLFDKIIVPE